MSACASVSSVIMLTLSVGNGVLMRQEYQVGRFFGISKKGLARRAHLRTDGQTAGEVRDLASAHGCRKVLREFSRVDGVAETLIHQRHGASGGVLQELPDLSV